MRLLARMSIVLALSAAACGKPSNSTAGGSSAPTPPGSQSSSDPGPIDPATVGTISGTIRLGGSLKPDPDIKPGVPFCAAQNPGGIIKPDTLILGEGQTMANVVVQVKSGLGRRKFTAPDKPVVLDQTRCVYVPHVVALMKNQPLLVRNSDDTLHNVHGLPRLNREFNRGQNSKGMEDTFNLPIPEQSIVVKCDVHPWMMAWVHVVDHPFFQVTGKDGAYSLSGLPPGTYEIQAWHEKFKDAPLMAQVKLEPKGSAKQDFTFQGGKKQ